jgi:hypothetical protein
MQSILPFLGKEYRISTLGAPWVSRGFTDREAPFNGMGKGQED